MTLAEYLVQVLTTAPSIAAVVGTRVYTEILPQSPGLPALVLDLSGSDGDDVLDGESDVETVRVQITSWAKTRLEASSLARKVSALLRAHTGAAAGLEVQGVFGDGSQWLFDEGTKYYLVVQEYSVVCSGESP